MFVEPVDPPKELSSHISSRLTLHLHRLDSSIGSQDAGNTVDHPPFGGVERFNFRL